MFYVEVRILDNKKFVTIAEDRDLLLESGKSFGPITVAYESYGQLNDEKDNCILVLHALTGDSHPAKHDLEDKEGWWEEFVGPGKVFDTNKYFIICSNVLGGCQGTTGPAALDDVSGKPYGARFPIITIRDMINVQKELLKVLGIHHLYCVAGGSMGGLQALQWAVDYPDFIDSAVQIASSLQLSDQSIAINYIMRKAIMSDSSWNNGDYYDGQPPEGGLSVARMLGMTTYQTPEEYRYKFKRKTKDKMEDVFESLQGRFEVESYLNYQGAKFNERFDANSYLYITRAMDLFDLKRQYGSYEKALSRIEVPYLVIAVDSDKLFDISEMRRSYNMLKASGVQVFYEEISSLHGHDSFLIDVDKLSPVLQCFFNEVNKKGQKYRYKILKDV